MVGGGMAVAGMIVGAAKYAAPTYAKVAAIVVGVLATLQARGLSRPV